MVLLMPNMLLLAIPVSFQSVSKISNSTNPSPFRTFLCFINSRFKIILMQGLVIQNYSMYMYEVFISPNLICMCDVYHPIPYEGIVDMYENAAQYLDLHS